MTHSRLRLALIVAALSVVAALAVGTPVATTASDTFNTVVIPKTTTIPKTTPGAQATKPAAITVTSASTAKSKGEAAKSSGKSTGGKTGAANSKATPAPPALANGKDAPAGGVSATAAPASADTAKTSDGKAGNVPAGGSAAAKAPPEPTEWPAQEIELAQARCTQLLKTVDAVAVPEAPLRKGECGTPAPVRLISLGKKPEVSFSPPPLVTCDMVVALSKWVSGDLQPLARKHLGGDIIKIETMSDYSCRKAYGRIANKLSEHGKANALDIRGFVTSKGQEAIVLTGWGQTTRDLERQIAAAKAEAEKAEALKAAAVQAEEAKVEAAKADKANRKMPPEATGSAIEGTIAASLPRATIIEGVPGISIESEGFGMMPTRLGGPKGEMAKANLAADKDAKTASKDAKSKAAKKAAAGLNKGASLKPGIVVTPPKPSTRTPTMAFLHGAHESACRIFGTTLGPEANEAHRNHFHVDMAERKLKKICD